MKPNKIIRSAFLAGLIGIAGCAPPKVEFSLSQIAERMDNIRASYSTSLVQVNTKMDQVMTSRYFSEDDQKVVYGALKSMVNGFTEYKELTSKCAEEPYCFEFSTNRFEWYPLLQKNVVGFDGGNPEIQKYFDAKYSGFKAGSIYSPAEKEASEEALNIAIDILNNIATQ
ncbi:MAG: hypothetical protein AABW75_04685 [Nanoarchaeota archaeon]